MPAVRLDPFQNIVGVGWDGDGNGDNGNGNGNGGVGPVPTIQGETLVENKSSPGPSEITVTKPSPTIEGDLLWVQLSVSHNLSRIVVPPSDWTEVYHQAVEQGSQGFGFVTAQWWKKAGAAEPADYTFVFTNDGGAPAPLIMVGMWSIFGVNLVTPINAFAFEINNLVDDEMPGITTSVDNCLLIGAMCMWGTIITCGQCGIPFTWNQRFDVNGIQSGNKLQIRTWTEGRTKTAGLNPTIGISPNQATAQLGSQTAIAPAPLP